MTDNLEDLLEKSFIESSILRALQEDIETGDLTTEALIPPEMAGRGEFLAKQDLVVCGLPLAARVFAIVDESIVMDILVKEGIRVKKGTILATVSGPYGCLLTAERTALNFLNHLCGIATKTSLFVETVTGTSAGIYDTRKTLPGLRLLEKYAVRTGGGKNHRIGLFDAVLIKDNHLATGKSIGQLVETARTKAPQASFIQVEVETLEQVSEAISALPDIIMLDNMSLETIRAARELVPEDIEVEVSGNVTLERVRDIALCGVDRISISELTHSAPTGDVSLNIRTDAHETR